MSTRSYIGILEPDETVTCIYCHFDGYPEHMGPVLTEAYNTEEKVRSLIGLGCLSSCYKTMCPDPNLPHTLNKKQAKVTLAYHRDAGQEWEYNKPWSEANMYVYEATMKENLIDYCYLFVPSENKWRYCGIHDRWRLLEANEYE